jgi:hypothetical protein
MGGLINLSAIGKINLRSAVLLTAVIVSALAVLLVGGFLTPRGFGVAVVVVMTVGAFVLYVSLKSLARQQGSDTSPSQSAKKPAKGLYFRVAIILGLFVVSAFATRGGPLLPRLIGAGVLILFLLGTIIARR